MFHTTLLEEYDNARRMGLSEDELVRLAAMSFEHAFVKKEDQGAFLQFR